MPVRTHKSYLLFARRAIPSKLSCKLFMSKGMPQADRCPGCTIDASGTIFNNTSSTSPSSLPSPPLLPPDSSSLLLPLSSCPLWCMLSKGLGSGVCGPPCCPCSLPWPDPCRGASEAPCFWACKSPQPAAAGKPSVCSVVCSVFNAGLPSPTAWWDVLQMPSAAAAASSNPSSGIGRDKGALLSYISGPYCRFQLKAIINLR